MTLLADLSLPDLPLDVLLLLRAATIGEIRRRQVAKKCADRVTRDTKRQRSTKPSFLNTSDVPPYEKAILVLAQDDPTALYALPPHVHQDILAHRLFYLPCLLAQDWNHLFVSVQDTPADFYVYTHIDPRGKPFFLPGIEMLIHGKPFYLGKGTKRRAWDLQRTEGHRRKIRHIRDAGYDDAAIVCLLAQSLTEREALVLEAKLIYFFGSIYAEQRQGCLFNLDESMAPSFVGLMRTLPYPKEYQHDPARYLNTLTHNQRRMLLDKRPR